MMIDRSDPSRPAASSLRRKPWHAVTVVSKSGACEAARAVRGMRFLSAEAPRLPLSGCANPEGCACAYKHFEDRRGQARRKEDFDGMRRSVQGSAERRKRGDRRGAD